MSISILEETTRKLFKYRPDRDDRTFIETFNDAVQEYYKLMDRVSKDDLDLIDSLARLHEERGFRNGFTTGMKLMMQTMSCREDDF